MHERRRYQRVPFHIGSHLIVSDEEVRCELMDISLNGAKIALDVAMPLILGGCYELGVELSEVLVLHFTAELVHVFENTYGFQFLEHDVESFSHLRRLLELNTGDPESISSELAEHLNQLKAKD